MTWYLYICIAASSWGCGSVVYSPMPNMETCFKALQAARSESNGKLATGQDNTTTVFACRIGDKLK